MVLPAFQRSDLHRGDFHLSAVQHLGFETAAPGTTEVERAFQRSLAKAARASQADRNFFDGEAGSGQRCVFGRHVPGEQQRVFDHARQRADLQMHRFNARVALMPASSQISTMFTAIESSCIYIVLIRT